jgi:glycerol-3-phosphate acyltransferase PlsX
VAGEIVLVGPQERLQALLSAAPSHSHNLRIVDAPQVVEMDESPNRALRSKPDSSLVRAIDLVRAGEADAAVSAGNSGAFMFAAQLRLRNLPGLQRCAIAVPFPGQGGPRILIDGGANMDCRPEHLAQFGIMGSMYAEAALNRKRPRVGLLSIGHENSKGDSLTLAAHQLLAHTPINFIGMVEGDQLFGEGVDVIVADGFVGNVALKVAEGAAHLLMTAIREGTMANWRGRLGGWLLRPVFRSLHKQLDYAAYGGALLLGVKGLCVVCHGRSNAVAIENAVLAAKRAIEGRVTEHLAEGLGNLASVAPPIEPAETSASSTGT